jgi:excisionase family DNA binding protein
MDELGNGDGPKATQLRLLLTQAEVAKALALSPRKVWSLTASGEIAHVRIGRSVRYDPADLRAWIDEKKKGGAN